MITQAHLSSEGQHGIYRHHDMSWIELRISPHTHDCYRLHTHAEYSVGIVDKGYAIFHHPSGPHELTAGSVVLIEPDVVHACNPLSGQAWSYRSYSLRLPG